VAETVYVFGAGVNRSVKAAYDLRPPLATDLFKQALRHKDLGVEQSDELRALFEYVERYWKLSVEDLREAPFDLEACFTLIQQQRQEANREGDVGRDEYLAQVEDQLSAVLTRFLAHIEGNTAYDLIQLGERVLEERAAVLTFNYDTIIEQMIEYAAGDSDADPPQDGRVPDEQLSYSDFEWNRALAYGVLFDEVELQQTKATLDAVSGERFYDNPANTLYDPPFLKLHGSLNWFVHTSRPVRPTRGEPTRNPKEGQTLLTGGYPLIMRGFGPPERDGWIIKPMVVTPVLYKELGEGTIGECWRRARRELSDCSRLVVAGYSFPPSDFAMTKLFLEAFADDPPRELVSVNPNRGIAAKAATLCHYNGSPLVRENLEEFIDHP
jgi:hypothetical protein